MLNAVPRSSGGFPFCALLVAVAASMLLYAGIADAGDDAVSYVHRAEHGFVRLERIEAGAPANAHPYRIAPAALQRLLAALKLKGRIASDNKPIFDEAELGELVAPLAQALAQAGAQQDVTFAVPGRHGVFGKYSGMTVTTGRVFMRDGTLHLIFGVIHDSFETAAWEAAPAPFVPGSRLKRTETLAKIMPGDARLAEGRPDWVLLNPEGAAAVAPSAVPEKPAVDASAAPAPADADYQDAERELDALERQKQDGSITPEQYRERRRAVLKRMADQ